MRSLNGASSSARLPEVYVIDRDVDFGDLQPGHRLEPADRRSPDRRCNVYDGRAVFHHDIEIDGRLPLADLHGYARVGAGSLLPIGSLSLIEPKVRLMPAPISYTPETSRAARPAILATTVSAMEVLPASVKSSDRFGEDPDVGAGRLNHRRIAPCRGWT